MTVGSPSAKPSDGNTPGRRGSLEFYSWYFFRISGLLLVVLALGHFLLMHAIHSILDVDYSFVVQRWAQASWRIYDWLLLVLALLHGFNGLRIVVNEHVRWQGVRRLAQGLVAAATLLFLSLGTYVLIAFKAS